MQAGADGLRVLRGVRVRAGRVELVGGDAREEVAHHRDPARPGLQDLGVRRRLRREDRQVHAVARRPRVELTERVERLVEPQDRLAQPRVRGEHQVPQRLRERPLTVHRHVDGPGGHRGDPVEGGRPRALQHGPRRAQAVRVGRASLRPTGEAAVQLGLDERDHVDPVDAEVVGVGEPRRVDVRVGHLDPAHHDAGQVGLDEPRAPQVRADERRTLQVVGAGEGCHGALLVGAVPSRRLFRRPLTSPRMSEGAPTVGR